MKHQFETLETCPCCAGSVFEPILTCKDHLVSGKDFLVVKCVSCSLLATSPRPRISDIGAFYKSDEYVSHSDTQKGLVNWLYHVVRRVALNQKRNLIGAYTKHKQLLDYGAGTGEFLAHMVSNGYSGVGVEPDAGARSLANQKHGLTLKDTTALTGIFEGSTFDIITMWHVLEHVHDPLSLLRTFQKNITTEGVLVIAVPNHKSKDAEAYAQDWAAYDVPRHLYHFNRRCMALLSESAGFELVGIKPMKFDSFYVSMLSEKNRGGGFVRGILQGLRSNLSAIKTGEYSSLIYILRPKEAK